MPRRGRRTYAKPPRTEEVEAGKVRLHHALAEAGIASRRACEQLIRDGKVTVNEQRVDRLPAFVDPRTDRVSVSGRIVTLIKPPSDDAREGGRRGEGHARRVYIMVHKPERCLTSTADREDAALETGSARRTVADLVKLPTAARVFPVGRLEFHASGIVLLTNDGDLTHRLTHARFGVPRTYRVHLRGEIDDAGIAKLQRVLGVMLFKAAKRAGLPGGSGDGDDQRVTITRAGSHAGAGAKVGAVDQRTGTRMGGAKTVIDIAIRGGKLVKLTTMLTYAGVKVARLAQVGIGPLTLKGLSAGEWRPLSGPEIAMLKRAARAEEPTKEEPSEAPAPRPGPPPMRTAQSVRNAAQAKPTERSEPRVAVTAPTSDGRFVAEPVRKAKQGELIRRFGSARGGDES